MANSEQDKLAQIKQVEAKFMATMKDIKKRRLNLVEKICKDRASGEADKIKESLKNL